MKPIKIFELKGIDWMKGLAIQSTFPLGGLFQSAENFNPFEKMGYLQATLAPRVVDSNTITTQVNHFVSQRDGYAYTLGDRGGTGQKSFYQINLSDYSVTDYSTAIDQNAATGALTHVGLTIFAGVGETPRLVYEQSGSLRSNTITPVAGNDTNILTDSGNAGGAVSTDFVEGSDLALYFTTGISATIGKIVTVTSTTGNTKSAFSLQVGIYSKSVTSDGYYIVAAGDNNPSKNTTVTAKCKIYFWDKTKSTADVIWDIPDAYLIGAKFVNGSVKVIGYSGIWECNLHTPPKLVMPISDKTILPTDVRQIKTQGNLLIWTGQSVLKPVYAYGSTIGKPILFQPYEYDSTTGTAAGLGIVGDQVLLSSNDPKVVIFNTGSSRANASVTTAPQNLNQPFQFAYAKITLETPISDSQHSISLRLADASNSSARSVLNTTTRDNTTDGGKKDLLFRPAASSTGTIMFEELIAAIAVRGGLVVKRLSVYGTPTGDNGQLL